MTRATFTRLRVGTAEDYLAIEAVEFDQKYGENCLNPEYIALPLSHFEPMAYGLLTRPPFPLDRDRSASVTFQDSPTLQSD